MTVITGGSIAGKSLTPKNLKPTNPRSMITRLRTMDAIGLLRAKSDISIFFGLFSYAGIVEFIAFL